MLLFDIEIAVNIGVKGYFKNIFLYGISLSINKIYEYISFPLMMVNIYNIMYAPNIMLHKLLICTFKEMLLKFPCFYITYSNYLLSSLQLK